MAETEFKDHFSGHASAYADARPNYPDALFAWLATFTSNHDTAWDCGTGNGQAALGLAPHFRRVIATDPSQQQIERAFPHARIEYRVAPAESPGLEPHSVDLVTVAQALHWFDRPRFYQQARTVLKPSGAIVAWCYGLCHIEAAIDARVRHFYDGETAPYWPPERRFIDAGYRTLDFPFTEVPPPALQMRQHWTLEQFTAYLRTWSAVQKFIRKNGHDPVSTLQQELVILWGGAGTRKTVSWPLHLRAAHV